MVSKTTGQKKWQKCIIDTAFFLLLGIYLLYNMSTTSTFFFPIPVGFVKCLFVILFSSVVLRYVFILPKQWKRPQELKEILPILGLCWICGVYLLVYHADGFPFLLFLAVLTVGCVGIDYLKLLRMHAIVFTGFLLITFFASLSGAIDNYVYMKDGYIRSAWGLCYPTDFASSIFFAVLFIWVAWRKVSDIGMLFVAILGMWVSKVIAMSSTSTLCFAFLACILLLRILHCRIPLLQFFFKKIETGIEWILILSFPIMAMLMLFMIVAYGQGMSFAIIADNLLSSRLHLAWTVFQECGITLFGTPFEQVGNGFALFSSQEYHFIDSTYPLVLLRYGGVLFLTYCVTWPYTVNKALKAQDDRLALAMMLIAVHSFSEHHFVEVNYNLLVVMPFAAFPVHKGGALLAQTEENLENVKEICKRSKIAKGLTTIVLLIALLVFPRALSWMRTVVEIFGWTGGGWNGIRVALSATVILAICLVCLLCIWKGILNYDGKGSIVSIWLIGGTTCTVLLFSIFYIVNERMEEAAPLYEPMIRDDTEAIQQVLELADGYVYVNEVPELYRKIIPELQISVFYKDELARNYNITAVMDRNHDSACFINSGFLFAPISERHAIYTNDMGVIRGLEAKGIHLTGYYNETKNVNLRQMAWINGLPYSAKSGVVLAGEDGSMKYGPYLSLYGGLYSVWYDFSLKDGKNITDMKEDEILATLSVSAHYGKKVLKEQKLFQSQFDENGKCTVEIKFWTGSYAGIEFQAQIENGQSIELEGLRYARTPSYDVHSFYNNKREKSRDEYYSLEGERITTSDGYASCEYEYNYDRVVKEIRYYDENNDPVLTKAGYAKIKRKLDAKNRVIREEYYGVDGEPILLAQGYAINEREYDADNNIIVQRYYDTENRLVVTTANYAEVHRVFDEEHRVVRESYYGIDGKPLDMPQGYSVNERVYDEAGNVCVQRYCEASGAPVMTTWNYAEVHREFNAKKQIVKESYYDTEGNPIEMPQGYAYNEREYDEAGNVSVQRYVDADGKRVMTSWNYAEVHREYNDKRQVIRESYFGIDGKPVNMPQGYAVNEREYDEAGNANLQRYCDVSGTPVITTWNYAEVHRVYDESRRVIEESYYGVDGKPWALPAGYTEVHREYNDKGQIIIESYYDANRLPVVLPQGYAVNERDYDDSGNACIQRYYDVTGKPVMTTWNYAEVHRVFDEKRRVIEESYFGTDGKPLVLPAGHAVLRREYNDKNQIIKESYYNVDGTPIALVQGYSINEREYDMAGNASVQRYCDASGNLVMTIWNFAEVHRAFDDKRRVIREKYFGTDGKPLTLPAGYAELHREYNDQGQVSNESYYNLEGDDITVQIKK